MTPLSLQLRFLQLVCSLLFLAGGLSAQGWERVYDRGAFNRGFIDKVVVLPDESLVLLHTTAVSFFNPDGERLWEHALPQTRRYTGINFTDGQIEVIGTDGDDDEVDLFFHRTVLDVFGNEISESSLLLDVIEQPLFHRLATQDRVFKTGPNRYLRIAALRDSLEVTGLTSRSNRFRFYQFDLNGDNLAVTDYVTTFESLSFIYAELLTDESLLIYNTVDRVNNGTSTNSSLENHFLHFRIEEDTLMLREQYFPGGTKLRRIGIIDKENERYDVLGENSGGNSRLLKFDFANDVLLQDDLIAHPESSSNFITAFGLSNQQTGLLRYTNNLDIIREPIFLELYDEAYSLLRRDTFYMPNAEFISSLAYGGAMPDGGSYFAATPSNYIGGNFNDVNFIARLDNEGVTFNGSISGAVKKRTEGNCDPVPTGLNLVHAAICLEPLTSGRDTLYAYTDEAGEFELRVDSGSYTIQAIPPNGYWASCRPDTFTLTGDFDTVTANLGLQAIYDCPLLTIDVVSAAYNSCDSSFVYLNYFNQGTTVSEPSLLEVVLDSNLTPIPFANFPWTEVQGDTVRYNIPPVEVNGHGTIYLKVGVDCQAPSGFSLCVDAHVYPDSLCTPPGVNWDGSSIEVTGRCENDSIKFEIRNVGLDMSTALGFVITEEIVIHLGGDFDLESGGVKEVVLPATGQTYRLSAEQSSGHPGNSMPSVTVEGCGDVDFDQLSLGVLNQFENDEGDPFIAIDCPVNQGLANDNNRSMAESNDDPAQLIAYPTGIGSRNHIDTFTEIEYLISVVNPLTVTGRYVKITDTLSPFVDPTTIRLGASSHPVQFSVSPFGVVVFEFEDIELNGTNEGSSGDLLFVQFKVKQRSGNVPSTIIRNRAKVEINRRLSLDTEPVNLEVRKPQRYEFISFTDCRSELDVENVIRSLDTISALTYDSIVLTTIRELPFWEVVIDTTMEVGDSLLGQVILMDTTINQELLTTSGCDSTVIYVVMTPSATGYPITANDGITVYPNPAGNYLVLQSDKMIGEDLLLTDQLGRSYNIDVLGEEKSIVISIIRLSPGIYTIQGNGVNGRWARRFVKE